MVFNIDIMLCTSMKLRIFSHSNSRLVVLSTVVGVLGGLPNSEVSRLSHTDF